MVSRKWIEKSHSSEKVAASVLEATYLVKNAFAIGSLWVRNVKMREATASYLRKQYYAAQS